MALGASLTMWAIITRAWRVVATGLSFSTFGVGAVILPLVVMPFIFLLSFDRGVRERRAKAFIHYIMRAFVEFMRCLGVLTYEIAEPELFNRPGQLILANHPTLIDVVFLIGFIKRADCVVKGALTRNPFTRLPIGLARYIANDDPEQILGEAAASLRRGNSLIIFPEGTRTVPGKPLRLQRGAANIALRVDVPVTLVVIRCVPTTLTKHLPWYKVPSRRFHFTMEVREQLTMDGFSCEKSPSIAARKLTQFLQAYFTQELESNERFGTRVKAAHH